MFSGERLRSLRLDKKLTQAKLGKMFNISHATINRYENGVHEPDTETIDKLAEFFDVTADYLLGRSDYRYELSREACGVKDFSKLPVLDAICTDESVIAEQNIVGYDYVSKDGLQVGTYFFLKVSDDRMDLSHIVEGQKVLVRMTEEVENGEIAVVLADGEDAIITKFFRTDFMVTLIPHSSNPKHQPRILDTRNTRFRVIGRVVQSLINF